MPRADTHFQAPADLLADPADGACTPAGLPPSPWAQAREVLQVDAKPLDCEAVYWLTLGYHRRRTR
jgi:hypothetical protein